MRACMFEPSISDINKYSFVELSNTLAINIILSFSGDNLGKR
jgi:hypothetical protein